MTSYQPPLNNPSIFDSEYFKTKTEGLTQKEMDRRYVRYPVAQGSETFPNNLTVNQTTRLNGNTTASKQVLQTLNSGAGNWANVNGYYALDKAKNPLPTQQSGVLATNTWSLISTPATPTYQDIYWSPEFNLFIAPAVNTNAVSTSPDGITFTSRTISSLINDWYGAASGTIGSTNYIFCVSSSGDNTANREQTARSTNGTTFSGIVSSEVSSWKSVCFSKELSLFVAVADGGTNRIMTTSDGSTWVSRSTTFSGNWQSVCWSAELGMFVAVANGGSTRVMYSYNGINWFETTPAANNQWHSVCWSKELGIFCAVSDTGSGGDHVMTSSDGIIWNIQIAFSAQWRTVVWAADIGLFCAVAISGANRIMTSRDAITWVDYTAPAVEQWHSVAWSPFLGIFCAVNDTAASTRAMISNLAGQNPTNSNVFNSPFNNIDSNGNWTFKVNNLTSPAAMDIETTGVGSNVTIQSNSASSIILNNHSIVNSNLQFPATFVSPTSANYLGYNVVSTTSTNANIVSGTPYSNSFPLNAGVWLIIMFSRFRKSVEHSPTSNLILFNTTISINTSNAIDSTYYEKYQYGSSTAVGYTFPTGTTLVQAVSTYRFLTLTAASTTIYLLNSATFTKNTNDQLENQTFAQVLRIA